MTFLKMFCASPGKTIAKGSGAIVASAKKIPKVRVTTLGSFENRIVRNLNQVINPLSYLSQRLNQFLKNQLLPRYLLAVRDL